MYVLYILYQQEKSVVSGRIHIDALQDIQMSVEQYKVIEEEVYSKKKRRRQMEWKKEI